MLFLTLHFLPAPPVPQKHPSSEQTAGPVRSAASMSSHASVDILEELQLIAAQNLEKLDVGKYYEVVRELGKGTYGKVDLVVHKIRGKSRTASG